MSFLFQAVYIKVMIMKQPINVPHVTLYEGFKS